MSKNVLIIGAFIFLFLGAFTSIHSLQSITGSVIGEKVSNNNFGFIFFILAVLMFILGLEDKLAGDKYARAKINEIKKIMAVQIEDIVEHISSNYNKDKEIDIIDLGGAKGELPKEILKKVGDTYHNIKATVVDLNKDNFDKKNADKRIKYIVGDATKELPHKYDVVLSRYVLHYGSPAQQEKMAKVVAKGITENGFGKIIEYVAVDKQQKDFMNSVYKKISEMKGRPVAYWLTEKELLNEVKKGVRKGGGHIGTIKQQKTQEFTADEYLKRRNELNNAETEELKRYMNNKPFYAKVLNITIKKK
jgi:hypothetical protein